MMHYTCIILIYDPYIVILIYDDSGDYGSLFMIILAYYKSYYITWPYVYMYFGFTFLRLEI